MSKRESASRLFCLFYGIFALGIVLLLVSVARVTAEGSVSPSEASRPGFKGQDKGAIKLPNGMDPMDVVRMVERNREEVVREASACEAVEETSRPQYAQAAGEVGSAFKIGGQDPAPDQDLPATAFDGTNYLVVWVDWRSGSDRDVYGARVTVAGSVLDPTGIPISTAADNQNFPAVDFDGTNYLVVWQDSRNVASSDIYGARVSVGGSVLDASGIAISTATRNQWVPAVAFDGTNYLVVWEDSRNGDVSAYDIYGARVSVGGVVLDPGGIAISAGASYQESPAIGFDGTNYLVVWEDWRSDWYRPVIYGARVSKSGTVLDPGGFTGLTFASAVATAANGCVTLSWQMGIEAPAASFMICRSESLDGEFLALDVPIIRDSPLSFSSTDCSVVPGKTYWYKIVLLSPAGEEAYGPIEVRVDAVPTAYKAYQSYPNPFNPVCTIRYDISSACRTSLKVFDVSGRVVRTLVDAWREPGVYGEVWDGKCDDGSALPSGVYFYRLEAGDFVATRKMVFLR